MKVKVNDRESSSQPYFFDSEEEELPEKVYDWDAIIANGPQFKYDDTFGEYLFFERNRQSFVYFRFQTFMFKKRMFHLQNQI